MISLPILQLGRLIPYRIGVILYPILNNYCKSSFANVLERTLPIRIAGGPKKAEAHSLICHDQLDMYIAAIKSLWNNLKGIERDIGIVAYDGGLIESDYEILNRHIDGIRIVKKSDYEDIIDSKLKDYPSCKLVYTKTVFSPKIFLPLFTANVEKIILIDSDIFFYQKPSELISWIERNEKTNYYLYIDAEYPFGGTEIKNMKEKVLPHFNSGLLFINKSLLNLDSLERFFDEKEFKVTGGIRNDCSEQAAYAHWFKNGDAVALDRERYNCAGEPCRLMREAHKDYVFRHFATAGKQVFYLLNLGYLKNF